MSSLRLTHQLQQKMILTPQLRQRIEMLQMTSLELAELIEQEMVANPILEEIQPGDEVQEISDNILDQNSDGHDAVFQAGNDPGSDAMREAVVDYADAEPYMPDTPSMNGDDPAGLDAALRRWERCGGAAAIVVESSRAANVSVHSRLFAAVAAAVHEDGGATGGGGATGA